VLRTMEETAQLYGWRHIRTPGLRTPASSSGRPARPLTWCTRVYAFTDRSERSLTPAPEGTAPSRAHTSSTDAARAAAGERTRSRR
jgi:histidyl-tRNA synthetase